jgi:hypothetical protein
MKINNEVELKEIDVESLNHNKERLIWALSHLIRRQAELINVALHPRNMVDDEDYEYCLRQIYCALINQNGKKYIENLLDKDINHDQ